MDALQEWLTKIESSHPVKWDLGLERVGQVARSLDVLTPAPLVFLVAGTNGKGSVCTLLARFLEKLGYKTGLSTSPHLMRFNERIVVDGHEAGDAEIVAAFEAVDQARGTVSLTYFEYACLASLWLFKRQQVDACVLEIGLGGRLDAMNIVEPDVAIVTRIAMDHQDWLGDTLDKIATEKAGIFREGKPAIIGSSQAPRALYEKAQSIAAQVFSYDRDYSLSLEDGLFRGVDKQGDAVSLAAKLPGPVTPEAVATALQALYCAGIHPHDNLLAGMDVQIPGRFQVVGQGPRTVLDVAHNPDAVDHLVKQMTALDVKGKITVVLGLFRDKDMVAIINLLAGIVDEWHFVSLDADRGRPASELAVCLYERQKREGRCYDSVITGYQAAMAEAGQDDCL
ncbi:MAG: bifunctional tetrahydrofolate synthase/dihydrofolate synthase, partial [Gammaproteobacteria bacterium]|nr:bifunctional tetrahydrofolate synthase/dihydrofolate synthase [Gammaproteobacteria bacterium]